MTTNTYLVNTLKLRRILIENEEYYSKKKWGFAKRWLQNLDRHAQFTDVVEYLEYLAELSLTTYRMEVSFVFDICKLMELRPNPFIEQHFISLRPSQSTSINHLLLLSEILSGLERLAPEDRYSLHFLGLSGMRSIDVTRMLPCPELDTSDTIYCRLPFSKRTATMTICEMRRSESEFTTPAQFCEVKRLFYAGYNKTIDWNKVRRQSQLSLHKFRNRKAIQLMKMGLSQSAIMNRLGWKTPSSLRRYHFLSGNVMQRFETIDEVVMFVRSQKEEE